MLGSWQGVNRRKKVEKSSLYKAMTVKSLLSEVKKTLNRSESLCNHYWKS